MCEDKLEKPSFPEETAKALLQFAQRQFEEEGQKVHFIKGEDDVNEILNPLGYYPHAFVLACVMDRQIKAENAWRIPKIVFDNLGRFDIDFLGDSENDIHEIFRRYVKHHYKKQMAGYFCHAVKKIKNQYDGDASRIWNDKPSSGMMIYRFMQFDGVGLKIATMATNILVRQFGIKIKDKSSIDISPDVHTVRVFQRLGLTSFDHDFSSDKKKTSTVYMARAINPEYPGIFDYPCWYVGSKFCDAQGQKCKKDGETCPFFDFCPSRIDN